MNMSLSVHRIRARTECCVIEKPYLDDSDQEPLLVLLLYTILLILYRGAGSSLNQTASV